MITSLSLATPITLAFDAIVGPPRQGVDGFLPPSLGVSLQPGDTVNGRFTFEPVDAPSSSRETNAVEAFPFAINIKSAMLVSMQFRIATSNNIHVAVDCINDSCLQDYDGIVFGCAFNGGGTVCAPNTISSTDPTIWASVISLQSNTSALDGADIPVDLASWQRFLPDGGITVSMYDGVTHNFYGFIGTVTTFRQTPEPGAFTIMIVTLLSLAARQVFNSYCRVPLALPVLRLLLLVS